MPHRKLKLTLISAILLIVVYVAMAYLVLPAAWNPLRTSAGAGGPIDGT